MPVTSLWSSLPRNWKMKNENIALSGVDRLKMATYFLHVGLGRLVDSKEVVKAREVGASGERP